MSAQQHQAVMAQARTYAAQLRIQMGLPPPGLAAAAVGGAVGQQQQQVEPRAWVSLGNEFGKVVGEVVGEVVIDEGGALPVGHVTLGNTKALIPTGQGALAVKQVLKKEVDSMGVRDLRVLPLVFDQQGNRRQDFSAVVARMTQCDMPGGGLQLDVPPSTLGVLKSMVARGLTPVTDHEHCRFMRWRWHYAIPEPNLACLWHGQLAGFSLASLTAELNRRKWREAGELDHPETLWEVCWGSVSLAKCSSSFSTWAHSQLRRAAAGQWHSWADSRDAEMKRKLV
eukprot:s2528_g7.t1